VGLAFGDVVDLVGDLRLLAIAEQVDGVAFVCHFGALEQRRWVGKRGVGALQASD
jgi:hypothetical protein